ncbi:SAM-dependent methyltransferase [Reichenbachiella sp. MALMAid0571]|uniref:SAM-dependent methyltransferase n=1 Tax=Reichenbachiella sp. MALMAid0571 TaxID=3143939 RepID=UPI0032DE757F
MSKGKLILIPTVISEGTQDFVISDHIRSTIKCLNYFLVENLRTARRFISSLKLEVAIESLHFELLDKDTPSDKMEALIHPVFQGKDVGVMSESGCPGVADPGALAVDFAHKNGIQVVPMVGPSSILMALMSSGFNGQSFVFHGYIPIDKGERIRKIEQMEEHAYQLKQTQIFMDTPYRNRHLLNDLIENCNPSTRLSIARDITGEKELIQTKTLKEWKSAKTPDLHKIPVIFSLYF